MNGAGSTLACNGTLGIELGTFRVEAGGIVTSSHGNIGTKYANPCSATITGLGSQWNNTDRIVLNGDYGSTLTVSDGGMVTTKSFIAPLSSVAGNGTINTSGAIVNADLDFDPAHSTASVPFGAGGTLNLTPNGGELGVGYKGRGSLRIAGGITINSSQGYLGYDYSGKGTATVTGAGSKWIISGPLSMQGDSSLTVEAGASVSNADCNPYYTSTSASVRGVGSTWTINGILKIGQLTISDGGVVNAKSLYAAPGSLRGNGTINASGGMFDLDLVFDAVHGTTASVPFGTGGTLNLTPGGGDLGVGYKGTGSLRIADGAAITSASSYLGYFTTDATGNATLTGAGSKWTCNTLVVGGHGGTSAAYGMGGKGTMKVEAGAQVVGTVHVGFFGSGTLDVDTGGQITSSGDSWLGFMGSGTVNLSGAGTTWTSTGGLKLGSGGDGTLNIRNGAKVTSTFGFLSASGSYASSGGGTVNVTGPGSSWSVDGELWVPGTYYGGWGSVNIEDGGQVSAARVTLGGYGSGSILVRGPGSKLIITGTDGFSVGGSSNQSATVENGGQVTINNGGAGIAEFGTLRISGANSSLMAAGSLGGRGTLILEDGAQISCGAASAGALKIAGGARFSCGAGQVFTSATISGTGSQWTVNGGFEGGVNPWPDTTVRPLTMRIDAGGKITTNGSTWLNNYVDTKVTVTGPGSQWSTGGWFEQQMGTITIADGGKLTAKEMCQHGAIRMHVTGNGMLVLGDEANVGKLTQGGTFYFYADPTLPAGTYSPVTDYAARPLNWVAYSGTLDCRACGGSWDDAAKTLIVAAATGISAGDTHTPVGGERLIITDLGSDKRAGVSFGKIIGTPTFSATPSKSADLIALTAQLAATERVLDSWSVSSTLTGSEVLLTFDVGTGLQDLKVWHLQGSVWSASTPATFTYNSNGTASFTVDSFSDWAVTGVPEPAATGLIGLAAMVLLACRRRR